MVRKWGKLARLLLQFLLLLPDRCYGDDSVCGTEICSESQPSGNALQGLINSAQARKTTLGKIIQAECDPLLKRRGTVVVMFLAQWTACHTGDLLINLLLVLFSHCFPEGPRTIRNASHFKFAKTTECLVNRSRIPIAMALSAERECSLLFEYAIHHTNNQEAPE